MRRHLPAPLAVHLSTGCYAVFGNHQNLMVLQKPAKHGKRESENNELQKTARRNRRFLRFRHNFNRGQMLLLYWMETEVSMLMSQKKRQNKR